MLPVALLITTPESFLTLSQAAVQYDSILAVAWGNAGDTITYGAVYPGSFKPGTITALYK